MTETNSATAEFEAFVNSGEVEVGDSNAPSQPEEKPAKADPVEQEAAEDDGVDEIEDQGEDDGSDEEDGDKPKKSPKEHQIERLKREKAELARQLHEAEARKTEELLARLENLEKGLRGEKTGGNQETGTPAPDPNDLDKYPLGHLDDRYIEDRIEWVAEKKAAERADAVLQRQQEAEQQAAQKRQMQELLEKVDTLSVRGTELYEDFQESVVESGMRGDWDLSQVTFEAASEADNGVQILYELSQDKAEASRVAKLSPFQQIKFVQERDAEIGKGKQPRRIPKAGDPPKNTARGANSRTHISPATDNLDDFEKAWEAEGRRSR